LGTCNCHVGLCAWWKAAKLYALVMPSSGASELVFSLLNNKYNDIQTRTLVDSIILGLYLAFKDQPLDLAPDPFHAKDDVN